MPKPKILTIYGTRPEAIKVAPVIKAIEGSKKLEGIVAVTAQHREMLDQVNDLFDIVPDHDLNIMGHGQTLNDIAARVIGGVDEILAKTLPDAVIVQGDTTTVMGAAISAFNRKIPVIHLEAGLRSGNIASPFPEEANRRLTSQVTTLHLAPTDTSKQNLLNEGVNAVDIAVTGNTVIDALLMTVAKNEPFVDPRLEMISSSGKPVLLVTTHRRENLGNSMQNIGRALGRIARNNPGHWIIFPAHRNPLMRETVLPHLVGLQNVTVTEPLGYGEFTRLLSLARIVLTDSGGVQEEAPSLGKPVLVMRENTERPEAVAAGTVRLIGTDEERIVGEAERLIHDEDHFDRMANAVNPYGDGAAAARAVAAIEHMFQVGTRLPEFTN
ncbi:UDP-N-acetylglucosamine 2-epimerase (non-hydrolyzing) [Saxibacter everestensis]|uniref:UDP-N-acetylglucosamine 2-epimerase (non-hydrolyzing) n=1 Tax=Saxibacter everestensis TaxID=2909229 RepID=A0ABY8QTF8_9MICO|nr:UDP-N-acetylglucosamine 2-epimerase (non-hydrolyzing) [Brevibacteriaceae bacterium ZFBP1038]